MSSLPLVSRQAWTGRLPVLALLHPREHTRAVLAVLLPALVLATLAQQRELLPTSGATVLVLGLLLLPGIRKWRSDARRYGRVVMMLSVLLAAQGFHTVEHAAQMVQFRLLNWPPFVSSGLISAADAEWIHFGWNWAVVAVVAYLLRGGMRGPWAWILFEWATAHALEHSYMLLRYLDLVGELRQLGYPRLSAQGLPGILGRDGWLARGAGNLSVPSAGPDHRPTHRRPLLVEQWRAAGGATGRARLFALASRAASLDRACIRTALILPNHRNLVRLF